MCNAFKSVCGRIKRAIVGLPIFKGHPDEPELAQMRDKQRLMKGVLYWRLAESFKARLWNERRAVAELGAALKETQKRTVLVAQARNTIPVDTGAAARRVAGVRRRMDDLQARLAAVGQRQDEYLQSLAVAALERQKQRIEAYEVQARYALATIYDRASNSEPKAKP